MSTDPTSRTEGSAELPVADPDPAELRAVAEEIASGFPRVPERTGLVLYDVAPGHLQAQWSVVPQDLDRAREAFPPDAAGIRTVLRLCRATGDAGLEVVAIVPQKEGKGEQEGETGFLLDADGATYETELGLATSDGGWLLLARSNRISMPRAAVPVKPTEHAEPLSGAGGGVSEQPVEPALAAEGEVPRPVFPEPVSTEGNRISDPSAPATRPPRTDAVIGPASQTDEAGPAVVQEATPFRGGELSSIEAGPVPPLLPSDPVESGSGNYSLMDFYDPRAALSSSALRDFPSQSPDLEVQAELVVHGRARPASVVEVFGLTLTVGADGRFSVRRSLTDPLLLARALGAQPSVGNGDPGKE